MKDILKIMRFDFLTASPLALNAYIIIVIVCFLLSLLFSPMICGYIIWAGMFFEIPLQSIADKSDFHKLYGILPVHRKNITRARFLYVFLLFFLTELLELVLAGISANLQLYQYLPNQDSELMQFVAGAFIDKELLFWSVIGLFTLCCILFAYMEMMGQIFGSENDMKIIIITLGAITGIAFLFFTLNSHGIIPTFRLPNFPTTFGGRLILGVSINLVLFVICMIFGEITANQLAKREL